MPFRAHDARTIFHELPAGRGPDRGYTWRDEVDALSAVLPSDRVIHLVGLSAGANSALAFVAAYPYGVARLSLVEPAWSFLSSESSGQGATIVIDALDGTVIQGLTFIR